MPPASPPPPEPSASFWGNQKFRLQGHLWELGGKGMWQLTDGVRSPVLHEPPASGVLRDWQEHLGAFCICTCVSGALDRSSGAFVCSGSGLCGSFPGPGLPLGSAPSTAPAPGPGARICAAVPPPLLTFALTPHSTPGVGPSCSRVRWLVLGLQLTWGRGGRAEACPPAPAVDVGLICQVLSADFCRKGAVHCDSHCDSVATATIVPTLKSTHSRGPQPAGPGRASHPVALPVIMCRSGTRRPQEEHQLAQVEAPASAPMLPAGAHRPVVISEAASVLCALVWGYKSPAPVCVSVGPHYLFTSLS